MKMLWIFLGALFFALTLISGCLLLNSPQEGSYRYTEKSEMRAEKAFREIPIWIDESFGEADMIEINGAVDRWNYALNGYIVLRVVDTHFNMEPLKIQEQIEKNGWLFMKIDSKTSFTPPIGEKGFYSIGFVERVGGNHLYLIRDRLGNNEVFGVTLHEIGHLLGSPHVGDRLMSPHFSVAKNQCIDFLTLKAVALWFHLPLNRLNYCYDSAMGDVKQMGEDAGVGIAGCQAPLEK